MSLCMKRCTELFLLLMLIVFVQSCTIEKRLHGRGYHITWHKRYRPAKGNEVKQELPDTLVAETPAPEILPDPVEDPEVETPEADTEQVTPKHDKAEDYPKLPREERKFEPLGVLSAKILAVAIATVFLEDHASGQTQIVLWSITFIVVLTLAFVLGIISMIRYLRHPRHYKFNIWALLSIVCGAFYLVMALLGRSALF